MATLHAFYLPPDMWHAPYTLCGQEAHHLSRVVRIRPGQQVRLFDGEGRSGLFVVLETGKQAVVLDPQEITEHPCPETRVTLAAGFSKALRRGWFLEKAVELEASALWLWQGDYSQASLPDQEKATWKAALVSGAKQCHNPWLPSLAMMPGGVEAIAAQRGNFSTALLLYEGDTGGAMLTKDDLAHPGDILVVVGPEGGFSQREATILTNAGIRPVSMGNRILRWETAAILALGLAWWARQ